MPVATNALAEVKYRWMAALCALPAATLPAPRLQFAQPYALLHQGVAMRYAPQAVSLGVVAARPAVEAARDPCALVRRGKEAAHFLRRQSAPDADAAGGSAPINARGLLALDARTHAIDAAPADLSGRTVFLGAGFGDVDTVITPFGPRNGVEVHAATFYSVLDPVGPAREWLAFLAEVAFGTVLGFLFHASWERARGAAASLRSAATSSAFVRTYLRARGWLLGNFALLAVVVVASVWASVWAYRANLWIDPGPVVLGIFLKSLLASRVQATTVAPGPFAGKAAIVDAVLWLPLVAWALVLVVTHGH